MEQVKESNLVINDGFGTIPLIDMLHVLKTQEITNDDLKGIAEENCQPSEIGFKKLPTILKDIALFPLQIPIPCSCRLQREILFARLRRTSVSFNTKDQQFDGSNSGTMWSGEINITDER